MIEPRCRVCRTPCDFVSKGPRETTEICACCRLLMAELYDSTWVSTDQPRVMTLSSDFA